MNQVMEIELSKIRVSPGYKLFPWSKYDTRFVEKLRREILTEGSIRMPILLIQQLRTFKLLDGLCRLKAYQALGRKTIPALVVRSE